MDSFIRILDEVTPRTLLHRKIDVEPPQDTPAALRAYRHRPTAQDDNTGRRSRGGEGEGELRRQALQQSRVVDTPGRNNTFNTSELRGGELTYANITANITTDDDSGEDDFDFTNAARFHKRKGQRQVELPSGLDTIASQLVAKPPKHPGGKKRKFTDDVKPTGIKKWKSLAQGSGVTDQSVSGDKTYANLSTSTLDSSSDSIDYEKHQNIKGSAKRMVVSLPKLDTAEIQKVKGDKSDLADARPESSHKRMLLAKSGGDMDRTLLGDKTYANLSSTTLETSSDSIDYDTVKNVRGSERKLVVSLPKLEESTKRRKTEEAQKSQARLIRSGKTPTKTPTKMSVDVSLETSGLNVTSASQDMSNTSKFDRTYNISVGSEESFERASLESQQRFARTRMAPAQQIDLNLSSLLKNLKAKPSTDPFTDAVSNDSQNSVSEDVDEVTFESKGFAIASPNPESPTHEVRASPRIKLASPGPKTPLSSPTAPGSETLKALTPISKVLFPESKSDSAVPEALTPKTRSASLAPMTPPSNKLASVMSKTLSPRSVAASPLRRTPSRAKGTLSKMLSPNSKLVSPIRTPRRKSTSFLPASPSESLPASPSQKVLSPDSKSGTPMAKTPQRPNLASPGLKSASARPGLPFPDREASSSHLTLVPKAVSVLRTKSKSSTHSSNSPGSRMSPRINPRLRSASKTNVTSPRPQLAFPRHRLASPRAKASPKLKTASPEHKAISPMDKGDSPRHTTDSPIGKTQLLHKSASPRAKSASLKDKTASPRDKTASPRDKTASPRDKIAPPQEKSASRDKTASPQEKSASRDKTASPQHKTASPRDKAASINKSVSLEHTAASQEVENLSLGLKAATSEANDFSEADMTSVSNRDSPRRRTSSTVVEITSPRPASLSSRPSSASPQAVRSPRKSHPSLPSEVFDIFLSNKGETEDSTRSGSLLSSQGGARSPSKLAFPLSPRSYSRSPRLVNLGGQLPVGGTPIPPPPSFQDTRNKSDFIRSSFSSEEDEEEIDVSRVLFLLDEDEEKSDENKIPTSSVNTVQDDLFDKIFDTPSKRLTIGKSPSPSKTVENTRSSSSSSKKSTKEPSIAKADIEIETGDDNVLDTQTDVEDVGRSHSNYDHGTTGSFIRISRSVSGSPTASNPVRNLLPQLTNLSDSAQDTEEEGQPSRPKHQVVTTAEVHRASEDYEEMEVADVEGEEVEVRAIEVEEMEEEEMEVGDVEGEAMEEKEDNEPIDVGGMAAAEKDAVVGAHLAENIAEEEDDVEGEEEEEIDIVGVAEERVRAVATETVVSLKAAAEGQVDEPVEYGTLEMRLELEDESDSDEELNLLPVITRKSMARRSMPLGETSFMNTSVGSSVGGDPANDSASNNSMSKPQQLTMKEFLQKMSKKSPVKPPMADSAKASLNNMLKHMQELGGGLFVGKGSHVPPKKPMTKKPKKAPELPASLGKNVIQEALSHFSKCRVTPGAVREAVKVSEQWWANLSQDLLSISTARRGDTDIDAKDIAQLFRRQGIAMTQEDFIPLVEENLPVEQWQHFMVTAYANNKVHPRNVQKLFPDRP